MGNRSYLREITGCKIDKSKVIIDGGFIRDEKDINNLIDKGLGEYINGWKIQGYWYDNFKKFLGMCLRAMEGLTEEPLDNYIEMEEEQGFKFNIYFYKEDDDLIVTEDGAVMNWYPENNLFSLNKSRMEALK